MMGVTFQLTINPVYVIIPLIFMCTVILISAWIPAKRASRVTPVEAIRQNDEIKINKKKIRTSKLITKIFGVEGEIALKNIKRNKRKYRITIISLFISIVLFISFSSYLQFLVGTSEGLVYPYNYDSAVYFYDENEELKQRVTDDILSIENIEKYSIIDELWFPYETLEEDRYNKEYYEYHKKLYEESFNINIVKLSDEEYREYIEKINGTYGQSILLNQARIKKDSVTNIVTLLENTKNLSLNLKIPEYTDDVDNKETKVIAEEKTLKIDNIIATKETIFATDHYKFRETTTLIVNNETYSKIYEWKKRNLKDNTDYSPTMKILIKTSEIKKFAEEGEKIETKYNSGNHEIYISNIALDNQEEKNLVLAIKILLYGFISLVTLIGVTSVFNTISTSISLRQKEFAMLRSMGLTPRWI